MKTLSALAALSMTAFVITTVPLAVAQDEELSKEVEETIAQFKKSDDTMQKMFDESAGYAVYPKVSKGAIGIGAAKGKGIVFEKGKAVGGSTLSQVTIGAQLGGQVYSEIVFLENEEALEQFKSGKVKMSSQATATAAADGAGANAKYAQGVLIFTIAQGGLMFEASVGGQKFKFEPYKNK